MIDCAPKPAIIDFSLDVVITRKREITRRGGAAMTTGTSITVQKGCDCRGQGLPAISKRWTFFQKKKIIDEFFFAEATLTE